MRRPAHPARVRIPLTAGLVVALALAGAASAQTPPAASPPAATPDAARVAAGRQLAESKCAACHAITDAGASGLPDAPTFRAIAAAHGDDALSTLIKEGITVGHPSMPNWVFSPGEAMSLVAYFRTLRPS